MHKGLNGLMCKRTRGSTCPTTWTSRTSSFSTTNIYGIAYDGTSRWVVTGWDDKLATSDVV